ncbi:MAG: CoA transferase, partial [Desulfobacterales bacterium]|nr:CoA transferase [Desulfobacterales bacterium]
MSSVLSGIRVIELASYALVPFAGSILAEWGADVIKVEHPLTGDPIRNTNVWGIPPTQGYGSFLHEITNRGKRSIGLDIGKPEGYAALVKLIEGADVFITNMLPAARRRFKIEYEDLKAINPRLVYARGSGMGQKGPEAEAGGFDSAIYWARAGVALA